MNTVSRLTRLITILIGLSCLGVSATAQDRTDRNCTDDNGVDRCAEAQQQRVRALFGVPSLDQHRAAGDQVRRAFYVDGYGRDVVAIAFVRSARQDPMLWIHFPQRGRQARMSPLTALVPQSVWEGVLARSNFFDRELVPLPVNPDEISICLHSWVYTVEAVDPENPDVRRPAVPRRRTEDACAHGLTRAYAVELERAALPLFPHCAALDSSQHRGPSSQLAACAMLGGDRMAAAEVMNRATAIRHAAGPDDVDRLAGLHSPGS